MPAGLEAALDEFVFSKWDPTFLATDAGQRGKHDVLVNRYRTALKSAVPWLRRVANLERANVVEVGCGSGSSTVALAQYSQHVTAYDIDEESVNAARARCRAYGVTNVSLRAIAPEDLLPLIRTQSGDTHMFVLYAVLEHQTWNERIETLSTLWNLLSPGGALVVIETPNRLVYQDSHTSELPFYHMLPDELAFRYLERVPREAFRTAMKRDLATSGVDVSEKRIRWGLGASYHEFEIALPDPLEELVVADGFEDEILEWFGVHLDEELLTRFFLERVPNIPIAFSRSVLNLVLRKPRDDAERKRTASHNQRRREEVTKRFPRSQPGAPTPHEPRSFSSRLRARIKGAFEARFRKRV